MEEKYTSPLHIYVIGFVLCILLTLASYFVLVEKFFSPDITLATIIGLGLVQAFLQLFFFLHLGQEPKPKWHTFAFYCMVTVLLVLLIGSFWIMYNLNYRLM